MRLLYCYSYVYIQSGPLKSNILNISLIFDDTKNVSNESGTVSKGTYFSHVVFFLGEDAKKIRRSLSLF